MGEVRRRALDSGRPVSKGRRPGKRWAWGGASGREALCSGVSLPPLPGQDSRAATPTLSHPLSASQRGVLGKLHL